VAKASGSVYVFGNLSKIIKTAEEAVAYLEEHPPTTAAFQLAISDSFAFGGNPDVMGAGMAFLMDRILGLGYWPDGFVQKDGFKLYQYKLAEIS